jgi:hypothetical protein
MLVGVVLLLIEYGIFQDDNGNGDDPTATFGSTDPPTATFSGQTEASITLSVDSGPPGTELTIDGSGFAPGETVVIEFHVTELDRVQADGAGSFAGVHVQVPSDWPFRDQFFFKARGLSSLLTATMPFQVT